MSIAWKSRFISKEWWTSIIALVIVFSQQCGFDLSVYIPKDYVGIINTIFLFAGMVGVTVDTSTKGLSDLK